MKATPGGGHDGEEQERGAHLQLAQRHRKITAGSFKGRKALEPEFATPGVVGKLALSFVTSGPLTKDSRITCQLPDHGWTLASNAPPNVVLQLPAPCEAATTSALPQVKASWNAPSRTLEFSLLNECAIPAGTPVLLMLSGVCTPETATPQGEAIVTSFEKLVVRSTVPPSTRGGQIIDGPSIFTVPKIVPGVIGGEKRWRPFNCCPGAVSDVTLSFSVHGKVPAGGKLLIELPSGGWDMAEHPKVLLRTSVYHNKSVAASWDRSQHALEISLGTDGTQIPMKTRVTLTVTQVKNPALETMHTAAKAEIASARLTTLSANGGVVDGPSKVEVARISELRESDFEVLTRVLDTNPEATQGDVAATGFALSELPDLLRRTGLKLSDELYQSLVVPCLPIRNAGVADIRVDSPAANSARSASEASQSGGTSAREDSISREELLNVFALVYAPAYKYGQQLRLACGRGHMELVCELISRGCNPNAADGSGCSAVHYAADYGQLPILELLVEMTTPSEDEEGESPDSVIQPLELDARDAHGWTPLMCAAANGHVDVLQRLLALGASLSLTSTEGRSALHWAATRGMSVAVSALLAAGANVAQTDRSGWTALHCAMLHDSASCAAALIEKGASLAAKDKLEYTAAFYGDIRAAAGEAAASISA